MSVASELTRIKGAKNDLKTSINAKTDSEHQITNETIDDYADFVDSITSGGGDTYWSAIGYSEPPEFLDVPYNYAKQIYDNWDATQTDLEAKFDGDTNLVIMPLVDTSNAVEMWYMFRNCTELISMPQLDTSNNTTTQTMFSYCSKLETIPLLDTSNSTNMSSMFNNCTALTNVPQFNTSKTTTMRNMFSSCPNLTDTSLDNVLKMCINTTSVYGRTKTLYDMGFRSSYYPATRIQALPSYQDFIDAGWTTGF